MEWKETPVSKVNTQDQASKLDSEEITSLKHLSDRKLLF